MKETKEREEREAGNGKGAQRRRHVRQPRKRPIREEEGRGRLAGHRSLSSAAFEVIVSIDFER